MKRSTNEEAWRRKEEVRELMESGVPRFKIIRDLKEKYGISKEAVYCYIRKVRMEVVDEKNRNSL